jgi:hypothetical protein
VLGNGPVYAGVTYRNFFLPDFIPALINVYYTHFSGGISLFSLLRRKNIHFQHWDEYGAGHVTVIRDQ